MKIPALSVWEPWASCIRRRYKRIETRSWYTSYRGPLLICASKRWTRAMQEDADDLGIIIDVLLERDGLSWRREFHPGMAVALVNLVGCAPAAKLRRPEGVVIDGERFTACPSVRAGTRLEFELGNYDDGRFGWLMLPLEMDFDPFPVRGAQGLFQTEIPDELGRRAQEVRDASG